MKRAELLEAIEKATREGTTTVNLSSKGITQLPEQTACLAVILSLDRSKSLGIL